MSDLFILDARNVLLTLFEYRRAVLLKNHRKKSRKRRCYLVMLFLTDAKVTSFLGASLSLGRLSSSPPPVALLSLQIRAAAVTTAAKHSMAEERPEMYPRRHQETDPAQSYLKINENCVKNQGQNVSFFCFFLFFLCPFSFYFGRRHWLRRLWLQQRCDGADSAYHQLGKAAGFHCVS